MKRFIVLLFLFPFFCMCVYAEREVINFDRNWLFARYGLQADGSRIEESGFMQMPQFDDKAWRQLDLPHDWGIEGPFRSDLEGYTGKLPWRGIGWYRKHFLVPETDKGKRYYLDFDGAMANAEIWLNGVKVGERPYGYISFRVDLTSALRWGEENVVAVRLNTEKFGSRWYPGAGIYRHVRLVKTGQVHVAQWGVFVTTPQVTDESAKVALNIKLQNHRASESDCSYTVAVYELDADDRTGKKVASCGRREITVLSGDCREDSVAMEVQHPKRWSLERPSRYLARVSVYEGEKKVDEYDAPFGIRTIQFTHDDGFLLNGRRVQIKGTCNHHDLGALGAAVSEAALRRQIQILKSFGCNAIRTSHNPPAPELLTLADKMGMLVMDEAFDCWQYGKKEFDYGSLFYQWHERDIESLVCRDRNHPSVILWSTGNEVEEEYHPEMGIARRLTEVVHRFDKTRPATFGASYPSKSAVNGTELQVDVHGMNYAAGCYGGPHFYGEFLNKLGHEHLSGYSSESSSTMSSRGEYFPRKFHVSSYDLNQPGWGGLVDEEFAALDRYPAICGEFVWTGFDYLGEPTPFNSDNSVLLNNKEALTGAQLEAQRKALKEIEEKRPTSRSSYFGIVDLAGFPKDRYYLYKAHWMPEEPMVHILPHWNFPDRVGKVTPVFVYTSGDEAELFLNGKSLGRKKKGQYEYRLKWEDVVYEPGELKAVAYKHGRKWAEAQVVTTGKAVGLKLTPDKKEVRSDGDDLVFVRVSLVDAQGREVPTAEPVISCKLEGKGRIVATDNGDPTCLIPFQETVRPAFNGLYLAIVKPEYGEEGLLRLTAEVEGIPAKTIEIKVKK